jgi:hypothetical protein
MPLRAWAVGGAPPPTSRRIVSPHRRHSQRSGPPGAAGPWAPCDRARDGPLGLPALQPHGSHSSQARSVQHSSAQGGHARWGRDEGRLRCGSR